MKKERTTTGPNIVINKNESGQFVNRVLIGTPAVGLVRMEWVQARYGQTLPTNWSHVELMQWMSSYIPLAYQVADAENLILKFAIEQNFEWLLFIEHDNILPPDTFIRLNEYMISKKVPVVGALYFTKSEPPEPMVYREFGGGYYADWKMGDEVWCKGIPFGCTLIHLSILRVMWDESAEYMTPMNQVTRRVFKHPQHLFKPESQSYIASGGTTDLQFCREVIEHNIFEKAGWSEYQKKEFPFLIDTKIFVRHMDNSGVSWPLRIPEQLQRKNGNGSKSI